MSNFTFNFPSDWNISFNVERRDTLQFHITKDDSKNHVSIVWISHGQYWEAFPSDADDVIVIADMDYLIKVVELCLSK